MKQGELNKGLYRNRFEGMDEFRGKFYQIFYEIFLCKYIPSKSRVLEIGAGHCELINAIAHAEQKVAFDINPDIYDYAADGVTAVCDSIEQISTIQKKFDVIIANNVLEHLTHSQIVETLLAVKKLLENEGILMLIQPNFRYCYRDFWMAFDHITPLDDRGVVELLESLEYEVMEVKPKFLPYTMKENNFNRLLGNLICLKMLIVKMYLRIPFLWNIGGKQMLIVAKNSE